MGIAEIRSSKNCKPCRAFKSSVSATSICTRRNLMGFAINCAANLPMLACGRLGFETAAGPMPSRSCGRSAGRVALIAT